MIKTSEDQESFKMCSVTLPSQRNRYKMCVKCVSIPSTSALTQVLQNIGCSLAVGSSCLSEEGEFN